MSNLLKKIAEIKETNDGKWVDTDTGEKFDYKPKSKDEMTPEQRMFNLFHEQGKRKAIDEFRDPRYLNQWNKVSPLNIIFFNDLNNIYAQDPKTAAKSIIDIIKGLNQTYGGDDTYGYVSDQYLRTLEYNLNKFKTTDGIVQYITNAYFQGIGQGLGAPKRKTGSLNTSGPIEHTLVTIAQNRLSLEDLTAAVTETQNLYDKVNKILEAQKDKSDNERISFKFRNQDITNPFLDETKDFLVDPIGYYGPAFLSSDFVKNTAEDSL